MQSVRAVTPAQRAIQLVHQGGRLVREVVQRVAPTYVARLRQCSFPTKVGTMLSSRSVAGSVVLVHIQGARHEEIGPGDEPADLVEQVHLGDDIDAHDPVEHAQDRLAARLGPRIGGGPRRGQRPGPGSAARQHTPQALGVNVAQRPRGVQKDDQIKVAEISSRAEQDLLRGIHRETLN